MWMDPQVLLVDGVAEGIAVAASEGGAVVAEGAKLAASQAPHRS